MDKVIIYTPTYRNEHTFSLVLDSYLRQSYKNIEVRVFDNSLADGFKCIQSVCAQKKDARLTYTSNNSQLGAHGNYRRIFDSIDFNSLAIVLAADMALADDAIEELIAIRSSTRTPIVMPATRNYDSSRLDKFWGREFFEQPYVSLEPLTDSTSILPTITVLERYFSHENVTGEFFKFSFFGCLFDGALMAGLGRNYSRFKFHGGEQYMSMNLLIGPDLMTYLPRELLWNFYGNERLGGTQRPNSDIGRMECIQACQMILEENEFFLAAKGMDIERLRMNQIQKAIYFKNHFIGFEKYADDIINRNKLFTE